MVGSGSGSVEKQDPDLHESEKQDPDPHQSERSDPDPHRSEKKQDPDPHQSKNVEALDGHYRALGGPTVGKREW